MSKNRKNKITKREEEQAKRVMKILFASLIIFGLLLLIGFSLF